VQLELVFRTKNWKSRETTARKRVLERVVAVRELQAIAVTPTSVATSRWWEKTRRTTEW